MKHLTLILAFISVGMYAQSFPSPYCDIDGTDVTVEEITKVDFAGTSLTNTDATSVLINETTSIINVSPDNTYNLSVQGNTYGDFDNNIVAFIDWNHNDQLDDANEIYEVGTLTNTTGNDGTSVNMDITIPQDAVTGNTRIRITKTYSDNESPAIVNPCAIEMDAFGQGAFPGYGQALDFTLNVGTLSADTFQTASLQVFPNPTQDILNIRYESIIQEVKIYNLLGQEVFHQKAASKKLNLNLAHLNSGIYITKLITTNTQHSFKLIKK